MYLGEIISNQNWIILVSTAEDYVQKVDYQIWGIIIVEILKVFLWLYRTAS